MIRADLLVCSPIFLLGLVKTLDGTGIKLVSIRSSAAQEISWLADVVLLDIDALKPEEHLRRIAEAARSAPVLVIDNPPAQEQLKLGEYLYVDFTPCPKA